MQRRGLFERTNTPQNGKPDPGLTGMKKTKIKIFSIIMEQEKFIPPVVKQTTVLELEDPILGDSKEFTTPVVDTGHESYTYTTDSYWE